MNAWWTSFVDWAYLNREHIVAITSLFGFLGTLVAAVTLLFTFKQLRDAKKALQSSNTYQIQKEAREIIEKLHSNPDFNTYVFGSGAGKPNSDTVLKAQRQLALVFHFYLSVYRQAKEKAITRTLTKSMGKDFMAFFDDPKVQNLYRAKKKAGDYDEEHEEMVEFWRRRSN